MKAEPGNKAYYNLYYNRENFLRLEADHALGTMDDDGHIMPRFMGVSDMDYVAAFNNVTFEIGWQRDTEHTYTLLYTVERKATEYISSYKSGMQFVLVYND
jgi:hypothetical protein